MSSEEILPICTPQHQVWENQLPEAFTLSVPHQLFLSVRSGKLFGWYFWWLRSLRDFELEPILKGRMEWGAPIPPWARSWKFLRVSAPRNFPLPWGRMTAPAVFTVHEWGRVHALVWRCDPLSGWRYCASPVTLPAGNPASEMPPGCVGRSNPGQDPGTRHDALA